MLDLKASFEVMRGVPIAEWIVVGDDGVFSSLKFPIYLKGNTAEHKTEKNAVMKCDTVDEAKIHFGTLKCNFDEVIAQESFEGIEMIVGVKNDAAFGKVLMVGFGGIFAEVKRDVSFRVLPVSRKDIEGMVGELQGLGVFDARKKYDLSKFYSLIEKVVGVVEKQKVVELDLNPVIVGEAESKIVDARLELSD